MANIFLPQDFGDATVLSDNAYQKVQQTLGVPTHLGTEVQFQSGTGTRNVDCSFLPFTH